MINFSDEIVARLDSALADGYSCLARTASKDGEPQISPKGSVVAFNRDTLAYWERATRSACVWKAGAGLWVPFCR